MSFRGGLWRVALYFLRMTALRILCRGGFLRFAATALRDHTLDFRLRHQDALSDTDSPQLLCLDESACRVR